MTRTRERLVLGATVLAWVGLLLTFALVTPVFGTPDEPAHVDAAFRLATGLGWPPAGEMHYLAAIRQVVEHPVPGVERTTVDALLAAHPGDSPAIDQMSQHPPTYWLVLAGVLRVVRFGGLDWGTAVLVLRLVDIVLVAALPVLVWATVKRLTRSPLTAVVAPFLLFAVPQLAQVTSGVTVWAPMVLLGAVLVWLAVRVLTGDRSWWTAAGLAVTVTGMSALTALGLVAVPVAALVVLIGRTTPARDGAPAREEAPARDGAPARTAAPTVPLRGRVLRAVLVVAVPAVVTGWWWVRTVVTTGSLVPDALRAVTEPVAYPSGGANIGAFAGRQWDNLTTTFFGSFGADQWPLPPVLVDTLAIGGIVVLGWAALRRTSVPGGRSRWSDDQRIAAIVLVWPALVLAATLAYNWRNYLVTHQGNGLEGRFLFVAVVALVLAQVVAWRTLIVRADLRRRLARAGTIAALAIAIYGLGVDYRGAWEMSQFRISPEGLTAMAGGSIAGPRPVAAVGLVFVVAAVGAALLVWRATAGVGRQPVACPPTDAPGPAATSSPTDPGVPAPTTGTVPGTTPAPEHTPAPGHTPAPADEPAPTDRKETP